MLCPRNGCALENESRKVGFFGKVAVFEKVAVLEKVAGPEKMVSLGYFGVAVCFWSRCVRLDSLGTLAFSTATNPREAVPDNIHAPTIYVVVFVDVNENITIGAPGK